MEMTRKSAYSRFVAVALLLYLAPLAKGAINCSDVYSDLLPCLGYLKTGNGKPTTTCCDGAVKLAASAQTTADRQAICSCLKASAASVNPKESAVKALPEACGVKVAFPITLSVDCSTIN